jgi:hypothetical protein
MNMTRVPTLLATCFAAMFATLAGASAAPLPASTGIRADAELQQIDYRRCFRRHGRRVCRYYSDDYDDYDDYPYYYGGGGIYLGFGHGHGHGGGHHGGGHHSGGGGGHHGGHGGGGHGGGHGH